MFAKALLACVVLVQCIYGLSAITLLRSPLAAAEFPFAFDEFPGPFGLNTPLAYDGFPGPCGFNAPFAYDGIPGPCGFNAPFAYDGFPGPYGIGALSFGRL